MRRCPSDGAGLTGPPRRGRVIRATGDVEAVYAGMGLLTAAIAGAFAFSPIRHGERYLAEAKAAQGGDGVPVEPTLVTPEALPLAEPPAG